MAILCDRGIFWWNDERIPDNHFAPPTATGGTLTIEDNGSSRLELDSLMPSEKHPLEVLGNSSEPTTREIQGLLKKDARYVLLNHLIVAGGSFRTNNVSHVEYSATRCLVSESRFRRDTEKPLKFRSLKIDLTGFEDWLWAQSIDISRQRGRLTARYKKLPDKHFITQSGKISIRYGLLGPHFGKSFDKELSLTEIAAINVRPNNPMGIEECQSLYQRVEELLVLLTSSDYSLDWPEVTFEPGGKKAKLYFSRLRSNAKAPKRHECLINFPMISNSFGALFANLVSAREQYGPGFYLYLGTRRGMQMFVEHRFVNLVWGLEAFDRHDRGDAQADKQLAEKIARILSEISKNTDRRWLSNRLQHAAEPNLAKRLYELFAKLPLQLDKSKLMEFCERCQQYRNDISHFGGSRSTKQTYDQFLHELDKMSDAIAAMYHIHLLSVIGIDPTLFDFKLNRNWPQAGFRGALGKMGLLSNQQSPEGIK